VRGGYRHEYESTAEGLARLAAEQPGGDTPPRANPDVLKSIQTPLDGASNDIEADRFRQAAGAEFDDDDGPSIYDGGGLAAMAAARDSDDDEPLNFDLSASLTVSGDDDDDDTDVALDLSVADRSTDEPVGHILDQLP